MTAWPAHAPYFHPDPGPEYRKTEAQLWREERRGEDAVDLQSVLADVIGAMNALHRMMGRRYIEDATATACADAFGPLEDAEAALSVGIKELSGALDAHEPLTVGRVMPVREWIIEGRKS